MGKNYTPIEDLIKKRQHSQVSFQSAGKEVEPAVFERPFEIKEVVEKSVEKEVEPYITPRQEEVKLDESLKKAGLQPVSGSIKFPDYRTLKFPISDEKVLEGLHAPINSSLRWLSEFIVYVLKKFHIRLKKVHGKVVRVLVR